MAYAAWGGGHRVNVEKQADMGLRRLPKKTAQALSADANTPVYMTFCSIVGGVTTPPCGVPASVGKSVLPSR